MYCVRACMPLSSAKRVQLSVCATCMAAELDKRVLASGDDTRYKRVPASNATATHLHFDVLGALDVLFDEDVAVAKALLALAHRQREALLHFAIGEAFVDAHAAAAASGFDQDGVPALARRHDCLCTLRTPSESIASCCRVKLIKFTPCIAVCNMLSSGVQRSRRQSAFALR